MDSTTSLLVGAAIVAVVGTLAVWFTLRRPARAIERRQRDEALAAASLYTPAERSPNYGSAPDPCAPGLSDSERVQAMRELLLRGDRLAAERTESAKSAEHAEHAERAGTVDIALHEGSFEPTRPMDPRDPGPTTSPMAWKPTQPLDDAEVNAWQPTAPYGLRTSPADEREHITI
ncbi:MAG: hypothetical protein AMXMBFR78_29200 [Rubrivivax sp.]|jgi:hypothetical protein|nr:hypothetical protein [Rubrivivax sp.]